MIYADGIVLIAKSTAKVQEIIKRLEKYLNKRKMILSKEKSETQENCKWKNKENEQEKNKLTAELLQLTAKI